MLDKYGTACVMPKKQEAGHLTHDCKFPSQVSWSYSLSSGLADLLAGLVYLSRLRRDSVGADF
jgi:hypothetical protein